MHYIELAVVYNEYQPAVKSRNLKGPFGTQWKEQSIQKRRDISGDIRMACRSQQQNIGARSPRLSGRATLRLDLDLLLQNPSEVAHIFPFLLYCLL